MSALKGGILSDILIALLLIVGLQIKHFIGDFVVQTPWMLNNRRYYGHPGGLSHAGVHMALSVIVLAVAGTPPGFLVGLVLAEGLVHYHVDWAKDNISSKQKLTPDRQTFWIALGADQGLHHLTYLAMVLVWVEALLA